MTRALTVRDLERSSDFFSVPPDPPFLSWCSLSRCFFDLRFFFFGLGSTAFISGSDSLSLSLELQKYDHTLISMYSQAFLVHCIYLSQYHKQCHVESFDSYSDSRRASRTLRSESIFRHPSIVFSDSLSIRLSTSFRLRLA